MDRKGKQFLSCPSVSNQKHWDSLPPSSAVSVLSCRWTGMPQSHRQPRRLALYSLWEQPAGPRSSFCCFSSLHKWFRQSSILSQNAKTGTRDMLIFTNRCDKLCSRGSALPSCICQREYMENSPSHPAHLSGRVNPCNFSAFWIAGIYSPFH